ncbi:MAG: hypothetical protein ACREFT_02050, partial [Acetobacteraceae bacterium]
LFSSGRATADVRAADRGSAERLLLDAAHRALRAPESRIAVVLHLARLAPPGPGPHHRRIARALLIEAAQRHDGQLFPLANGDLVLLCRPPATAAGSADDPGALPGMLRRLFAGETPEPNTIVSLWPLADQSDRLLSYARERSDALASPSDSENPSAGPDRSTMAPSLHPLALPPLASPSSAPPAPPLPNPAPFALPPAIPELLQRRTAALISRTDGVRAHAIQALFRDISFSAPALDAHYAPPGARPADSWLCRHLTHHFDEQLLALVEAALPGDGPLGMANATPGLALHLSISPEIVVRPRFDHFATLCRALGIFIGIEVPLIAAAAAPAAFAAARAALHRSGFRIVLGGISPQALRLTRPQALEPDLLKLDWTPRLARLAEPDQRALAASVAAIGPDRVVLQRADTEAAMVWGLGQGIRRFLGAHVDAMLAAQRMLACPAASACTLHQCIERAASAAAPGRRLCRNLPLLDARAPTAAPTAASPVATRA